VSNMTDTTEEILDLYDTFHTNKEGEEEGRWFGLTPKTAFKIRALSAKAVLDKREVLTKPFTQMLRAGLKIPNEQNEEITLRVIASSVISEWKGVKNKAGEIVPYSEQEAFAILKDLPKLATWVASVSADSENFKDQVREDGAKNS
jgi:hypothetical protein